MYKNMLLVLALFFSGVVVAQEKADEGFILQKQFKDYIPISPLEYEPKITIYNVDSSKFEELFMRQLASQKKMILNFLPNEAVYVTVQKFDANGNISFGPASITAAKGNYTVIMDYCKFTTLKVMNGQNTCAGFTKVGVGLRITANIQTSSVGLNTGSLFSLGIAAQMGKLKGTLSVDVIGMESTQITDLIPLPSEISPTSIQNALQAIAAIKTKIYDQNTSLFPQVVAIKKVSDGECSVFDIINTMDKSGKQQQQQQQQQQREEDEN